MRGKTNIREKEKKEILSREKENITFASRDDKSVSNEIKNKINK